jgi:hypothetical protein
MQKINLLIVAALILALLPWGSFVPKFGSLAQHGTAVQGDVAARHSFAAMPKLCKGPFLPGTSCSPVHAVLPAAVSLGLVRPIAPRHRTTWQAPRGQQPPVLLEPPRLG